MTDNTCDNKLIDSILFSDNDDGKIDDCVIRLV